MQFLLAGLLPPPFFMTADSRAARNVIGKEGRDGCIEYYMQVDDLKATLLRLRNNANIHMQPQKFLLFFPVNLLDTFGLLQLHISFFDYLKPILENNNKQLL